MFAPRNRKLAILGVVVLGPLVLAGAAHASDEPTHIGNPNDWGPPLAALCESPADAAAAGYNVIIGNNNPNAITGTPMADAIFSLAGDEHPSRVGHALNVRPVSSRLGESCADHLVSEPQDGLRRAGRA